MNMRKDLNLEGGNGTRLFTVTEVIFNKITSVFSKITTQTKF